MMQTNAKSNWFAGRVAPLVLLAGIVVGMAWLTFPINLSAQDEDDQGFTGDFTVGVNPDDIPPDLFNGPSLIGQWRIGFNSDGSYEMERLDLGVVVTGSFEVESTTLTITDEAGLMSCSNLAAETGDQGDVSAGAYEWTLSGERLSLNPVEDNCKSRQLLLSTRELIQFVNCTTPLSSEVPAATPAPAATPVEGTPVVTLGLLRPDAQSQVQEEATPEDDASPEASGVEQEIDALIDQMTACWATGDPARFLPLVSENYREILERPFATEAEFLNNLANGMASPITFERSGDVAVEDDTRATAIVRTETGPEESFVRFGFVLEDGSWKWDGPA